MKRRQSIPHTFEENIAAEKAKLEAQLAQLKPGPQMDGLLKKIRQIETAMHINEWLSSPGLQPPDRQPSESGQSLRGLDFGSSRLAFPIRLVTGGITA